MAIDFPSAPTVGQHHPATPTPGIPTYVWDGEKWMSDGNTGLAPIYVVRAGDAMEGPLHLSADPVVPSEAANKSYVDAKSASSGGVPSGSVMLFYNAAAPVGWTKLTTQNDKALRVVSGAGGVAGGTNSFSTVLRTQSAVGNHTLSGTAIPQGLGSTGANTIYTYPGGDPNMWAPFVFGNSWIPATQIAGGSGNYSLCWNVGHQWGAVPNFQYGNNLQVYGGGSGGAHNHPITTDIQYLDVILATKD